MGDTGDDFRAMREHYRRAKAKFGVPCPECVVKLPKANPSILLPGTRCRIHGYRDPRPAAIDTCEQTPQLGQGK